MLIPFISLTAWGRRGGEEYDTPHMTLGPARQDEVHARQHVFHHQQRAPPFRTRPYPNLTLNTCIRVHSNHLSYDAVQVHQVHGILHAAGSFPVLSGWGGGQQHGAMVGKQRLQAPQSGWGGLKRMDETDFRRAGLGVGGAV